MNIKQLPNLDTSVVSALNFFIKNSIPKFNLKIADLPFIIGSGNAYNTGKIIFHNHPAVFANESNLRAKLLAHKKLIKDGVITQAVIISASGEKDAVWEIVEAKKYGLKTILMTCSPDSASAKLADEIFSYKKIAEPQTYNISTYLGMIISYGQENPKTIKKFIQKIKLPKNFAKYKAYSIILPDEMAEISPMLDIKKHELFGPHLSLRSFSYGDARHAKFVMPWEKELVISLGKNKYFGKKESRYEINLPKNYGPGLVISLTYYLIGKIQASKKPYYKKHVAKYCLEGPRAYGQNKPFEIIVPGN